MFQVIGAMAEFERALDRIVVLARPEVNEFRKQFFLEHCDASFQSLQPSGLAASDSEGFRNAHLTLRS